MAKKFKEVERIRVDKWNRHRDTRNTRLNTYDNKLKEEQRDVNFAVKEYYEEIK